VCGRMLYIADGVCACVCRGKEVGLYVERELVAQQQRLHEHRHLRLHRELPVTPKLVKPKVSMGHC
jgi:hypothetical protein